MKHFLFILGVIVAAIIALRVLYWAVSNVLVIAAVVLVVYFGVRMLLGRRDRARNPRS
jgi:chromate transport protein ChrA